MRSLRRHRHSRRQATNARQEDLSSSLQAVRRQGLGEEAGRLRRPSAIGEIRWNFKMTTMLGNRTSDHWEVLDAGPGYCVKRIRVVPGGILSLQRHAHRAERWTIVMGSVFVVRNQEQFDVHAQYSVEIARGDVHRMENRGIEDAVIIEVQIGTVLREDDIERLEDVYGRT
jgi:mannose-6-phosphate isomerase-like protein (cupin superfamily)